MKGLLLIVSCVWLAACGGGSSGSSSATNDSAPIDQPPGADRPATFASVEALGEALFHDPNLSLNRTQSCAVCHNPDHAFIDNRLDASNRIGAVSLGDDGKSLGDRNAPTAAYASFVPDFEASAARQRHNPHGKFTEYQGAIGGQFHDGREVDLKGQAGGPPLNPLEMAMPDKETVVKRLLENDKYVASFQALFNENIFDRVDDAYLAMTTSIGRFEKTDLFAPFDSKYDRFLAGEYELTEKEAAGRTLFFSSLTNCSICHQLHDENDPVLNRRETFSGYEYHNIGVPENTTIRALNGVTEKDAGLYLNPKIDQAADKGKFKTPTLRNVAVTEPYMHNGVHRDLKTVIEFYDQFVNPQRVNNPETGLPWEAAEFPDTVSQELLEVGKALDDQDVESMVCFLRALTDQRYEHLIQLKGIDCDAALVDPDPTDPDNDRYPEIPAEITDPVKRGEFLFKHKYTCSECHGDDPGLEDIPDAGLLDLSGNFIDRGNGLMDFLRGRITGQEIQELKSYLSTLD